MTNENKFTIADANRQVKKPNKNQMKYVLATVHLSDTGLKHLVECTNKKETCTVTIHPKYENQIPLFLTNAQVKKITAGVVKGKSIKVTLSKAQLIVLKGSGFFDWIK